MTKTTELTDPQIAALEAIGREIAKGWIEATCNGAIGEDIDPDYDFSADGDWQAVREAAIAAGIDWDPDCSQPETGLVNPVWSAVKSGYQDQISD